jgi:hypothetical protein
MTHPPCPLALPARAPGASVSEVTEGLDAALLRVLATAESPEAAWWLAEALGPPDAATWAVLRRLHRLGLVTCAPAGDGVMRWRLAAPSPAAQVPPTRSHSGPKEAHDHE